MNEQLYEDFARLLGKKPEQTAATLAYLRGVTATVQDQPAPTTHLPWFAPSFLDTEPHDVPAMHRAAMLWWIESYRTLAFCLQKLSELDAKGRHWLAHETNFAEYYNQGVRVLQAMRCVPGTESENEARAHLALDLATCALVMVRRADRQQQEVRSPPALLDLAQCLPQAASFTYNDAEDASADEGEGEE